MSQATYRGCQYNTDAEKELIAPSIATYRGCQYNTDVPKKEYRNWYSSIHAPSHPPLRYRGQFYRPCNNWDWENVK